MLRAIWTQTLSSRSKGPPMGNDGKLNGYVTDDVMWPWKVEDHDPDMHRAGDTDYSKGPLVGNGIWRIEWSRDVTWRHVTLKGQGYDNNMFEAHYINNGWRYRLDSIAAPTESRTWGIKCSRAWWRYVNIKLEVIPMYLLSIRGIRGYNGHVNKSQAVTRKLCNAAHPMTLWLLFASAYKRSRSLLHWQRLAGIYPLNAMWYWNVNN